MHSLDILRTSFAGMSFGVLNDAFWWTGAIVWAGLVVLLAIIVFELAVGFACAISWVRWRISVVKEYKGKLRWKKLPGTFLSMWLTLAGHRNNGSRKFSCNGGYWHGIGDWKVFPNKETDKEKIFGANDSPHHQR